LELAAAMAYLNGDNGQRNSSRAVQQLWAAVRNGNTEAEVILSDLYVTGDGVAKNCEQGRVLLGAAAKNGNAEAKVKLDDLNSNGCE
jgi:TPR repeat protein